MEKDFFKDRPEDVKFHHLVSKGNHVFLCTKENQKIAKELKDLDLVIVQNQLTGSPMHNRGQKVSGFSVEKDNFGNNILDKNGNIIYIEKKGRCTYIVDMDDTKIKTNQGEKYITLNKNGYQIVEGFSINNKFKLILCLVIGEIKFFVEICKYLYFNTMEEAIEKSKEIEIGTGIFSKGMITLSMFDYKIRIENAFVELQNETFALNDDVLWNYIISNYESYNNAEYSYNKNFLLEKEGFYIEQIE